MIRKFACPAALFVFAISYAAVAEAGKFNKVLSPGDQAPEWTSLVGTDDKQHSLADYKNADVLVLVFTCNHCPVAIALEDRIIELQKDYAGKKVQVIAVNVNKGEDDDLDNMKERVTEKGFNFPYLFDPSQAIARDYGARVTPDVVVLNKARKVVYTGAIDDNWKDATSVGHRYVRDAIDATLGGQEPKVTETRAEGCGIRYEK
ncbi:MAG: thioredoxin family protein [Pirellulales bacterium]|nr:thioredoxin family protein [Pirellulales bacterium]